MKPLSIMVDGNPVPTVKKLQLSALDLLDRMLACGEHCREEEA